MSEATTALASTATLFEIDAELEAAFDVAAEEQEQTGAISDETRQRCTELFGELGKKVDRIARYVRAMELRARAAKEEAMRLAARQRAAENRVEQVKSMLMFFMQSRGLRRLEGDLNTIRLQKNGQASLRLDPLTLPPGYQDANISIPQPEWDRMLDLIPIPELRQKLEKAVIAVEPNKGLIRQDLQTGKQISGAELFKGEHIRFD